MCQGFYVVCKWVNGAVGRWLQVLEIAEELGFSEVKCSKSVVKKVCYMQIRLGIC